MRLPTLLVQHALEVGRVGDLRGDDLLHILEEALRVAVALDVGHVRLQHRRANFYPLDGRG
eukprot:5605233-Pyramimonas_sp.AAC.1